MANTSDKPALQINGLATIAFLKTQLDERQDCFSLLMPIVIDVLQRIGPDSFTVIDFQSVLFKIRGITIPQQTLITLLKRCVKLTILNRDAGRYWKTTKAENKDSDVTEKIDDINTGHNQLATALIEYASNKSVTIGSSEYALSLLLEFIDKEQVGLLLNHNVARNKEAEKINVTIAEFVCDSIRKNQQLKSIIRGILEGLVVYKAVFASTLNIAPKKFNNLRVIFDSHLVRQALGYEGQALELLMRESIDILKSAGAVCIIFENTVLEIKRILSMFESKISTEGGRRSLKQNEMARHILTKRYTSADIRMISAMLETNIHESGLQIMQTPTRLPEFTSGERSLSAKLANPSTHDESEPRVIHDVDCIAGAISFRKGHRSSNLDDSRAIFVTSSPLLIANVRDWWTNDENEIGVPPVAHIQEISNRAWLINPTQRADFKLHEIIAVCTATLRPKPETWRKFVHHLDSLVSSNTITSDEMTAIVISDLSDQLLKNAEFENYTNDDIDSTTLDEVVARVKETYREESNQQVNLITSRLNGTIRQLDKDKHNAIARAEAAERKAMNIELQTEINADVRARGIARPTATLLYYTVLALAMLGSINIAFGHHFSNDVLGILLGSSIVVFLALETFGVLGHLFMLRNKLELWLKQSLREFFLAR